ncbi:MAG: TVP38/TMEM64 family protein [Cyanobacteria bacterium J06592_8]
MPFFLLKLLKTQRFWLILGLASLLWMAYFSPWRLENLDPVSIRILMEQWGHWAVFGYILLYVLLTIVGIPAIPLTMAGGIFFGLAWGTIWSLIAATIGAIAAFCLTRYLLQNWAQTTFGRHRALIKFNRSTTQNPFKFVLFVRIAPIFPFNLANFLFGLTPIQFKPYVVGTFLGIIPGTLTYTWLGATGKQAIQGSDRLSIFLALAVAAGLCVLPSLIRQKPHWSEETE